MIKAKLSEHWKRYLVSSGVTFAAGFIAAVLPLIGDLSLVDVQNGALLGILLAGLRGAVKLLFEAYMGWYAKRLTKKKK